MRSAIVALLMLGVPALVSPQSLGDAAAKQRARREKEKREGAAKPVRTYSNTDIEPPETGDKKDGGSPSASAPDETRTGGSGEKPSRTARRAGQGEQPEGDGGPSSAGAPEGGPSEPEKSSRKAAPAHQEQEEGDGGWGKRAAAARQQLQGVQEQVASAERRVNALRQKLNPMSATYYQDTDNGETGTLLRLRSELTDAEAALADAQKGLGPAKEAWEAFEREARAGGAPAEVLKPPAPPEK